MTELAGSAGNFHGGETRRSGQTGFVGGNGGQFIGGRFNGGSISGEEIGDFCDRKIAQRVGGCEASVEQGVDFG